MAPCRDAPARRIRHAGSRNLRNGRQSRRLCVPPSYLHSREEIDGRPPAAYENESYDLRREAQRRHCVYGASRPSHSICHTFTHSWICASACCRTVNGRPSIPQGRRIERNHLALESPMRLASLGQPPACIQYVHYSGVAAPFAAECIIGAHLLQHHADCRATCERRLATLASWSPRAV